MDMICDICGHYGIHWVGLTSLSPSTRCPHCGGKNCQRAEMPEEDEEMLDQHGPEERPDWSQIQRS